MHLISDDRLHKAENDLKTARRWLNVCLAESACTYPVVPQEGELGALIECFDQAKKAHSEALAAFHVNTKEGA